ncbi:hypothetical protein XELAEV_18019376mg [Xenopus laevis]|uniref:G-protein coupled receptors family 1 profile domain-containing protein n=1 Tax=Xenopus laevis TaxID=8355 RepID=A0A974DEY7_XENLA|nr:hypothetical protein XELAEV_18019376mg [Xenopus laevis]
MNSINSCNRTKITQFLLLGFQGSQTLRSSIFLYMSIDLHYGIGSPMYFLLRNLSVTDILLATNIVPNLLSALINNGKLMSVSACVTQYFAAGLFTGDECLLLTVMAYDRYLAICKPLHYVTIMTNKHCVHLVIWAWVEIVVISVSGATATSHSGFCGCNTLDYIYCDYLPLLEVSCADVSILERLIPVVTIPVAVLPFLFIFITYICIFHSIFRISSNNGKQKAFSTCSSHLTVVCTYYGILFAKYIVPFKRQSLNVNKIISLLYMMVTPLLNPIIYSFRNEEIWKALNKWMSVKVLM